MTADPLTYSAAFMLGLLGSAHCVGMCGGIMGALTLAVPPEKRLPIYLIPTLLFYNLGRILSYGVAGALLGSIGWLLSGWFDQAGTVLRSIAALMLIAMGLYLGGWWSILVHVERIGNRLWQKLQPAMKPLMPVKSPLQAALLGVIWGWIPCGLIYSTLTWAATAASWQQSGLIMLVFGLGTLPAVLATGLALDKIKGVMQSRRIRGLVGLLLIAFGLWTLPLTLTGMHKHNHAPGPDRLETDHSPADHAEMGH